MRSLKPVRNGPRVNGRDLDAEFLEFIRHGFGDGFNGMLGGRIYPGEGVDVQTLPGRDPDDSPGAPLDHLLRDPLSEQKRSDDVNLELIADVERGDLLGKARP